MSNADSNPTSPSTEQRSRLTADHLRWKCDLDSFTFATTADVDPAQGILGQPTAYEALKFGIQCDAPGQNVFVRGPRGTGRITMVRKLLEELQPTSTEKRDFCYVHNFSHRDHPRLITLPPGRARPFRRQMNEVAGYFQSGLAQALESEPHTSNRNAIQQALQVEIRQTMEPLEKELQANGMALVSMQQGPASQTMILPVIDGEPVPAEQLKLLVNQGQAPAEQLAAFEEKLPQYQQQLQEIGRQINQRIRTAAEEIRALNESVARQLADQYVAPIRDDFPGEDVRSFLEEVVDDVVESHLGPPEKMPDFEQRYGVNVVLTHDDDQACPVVFESNHSLLNLLGAVEPEFGPNGMPVSDYRGISAGALLRADHGFLILEVNEVLSQPGAWHALMRTLRTGQLEIVPPEIGWMRQSVITLPEPIAIKVRVILIGDANTYYQLDSADPDFREQFKVLADFDSELPRDDQTLRQYASVVAGLSRNESLPDFDRGAVAALAEHGARIVARRQRLTAKFGRIADLAREAAFLAAGELVTREHVIDAIRRTKARASLPSIKFFEMVRSRTILVETTGERVGQINGLAVMRAGPLTYGFPARITASIGPGSAGLINIEGQAQMSGSIHTKGFHILGGLLRTLLRTNHPLAFSASLAFEQSYGGIDGDSASGAEVVCLISALTRLPVRQSMAMTGAIDQHGNLEAIGGVNEKIEGFFDACNFFGLTGQQGVVIPQSNANNLMLRQDVVDAAAAGNFHVYAVDNIFDALELMIGIPAGRPDSEGKYPPGSLLARAHDEVETYWRHTFANPQMQRLADAAEAEADGVSPDSQPVNHDQDPTA